MALESAIEKAGVAARTMSALAMPEVCETYERRRALRHLEDGRMVLLAAGTGNPFFTTDTTAVLRAAEIGAEAVLKATDVDGVYSADPKKDKNAKRYERLTHQEAIERNLKVMDATAFALARENRMPIIVFSIREKERSPRYCAERDASPSSAIDGVAYASNPLRGKSGRMQDRPTHSRGRHGKPNA